MFRARWAALALSAGLLVTSSGCFGQRLSLQNRSDCDCMETYGGAHGYEMTGTEGPMMAPPTFPAAPPMTTPQPMTAPPPRIVPIPANPQPYAPVKLFRNP
jgi:hypothetical protein